MSGQMKNYKKYFESIKTMTPPADFNTMQKQKFDIKGLLDYAESKGVKTSDLTMQERERFIRNV